MEYFVFDCHEETGYLFATNSKVLARLGSLIATKIANRSFDWLSAEEYANEEQHSLHYR